MITCPFDTVHTVIVLKLSCDPTDGHQEGERIEVQNPNSPFRSQHKADDNIIGL